MCVPQGNVIKEEFQQFMYIILVHYMFHEGTVMLSFPSKQIYDMYIEFCQFKILPFNNNGVFSDT